MTSPFHLLSQTLEKELGMDPAGKTERGDMTAPRGDTVLPAQFYAKDYFEFKNQFVTFLENKNLNSIFILTDGVFKKTALHSMQDITDFFLRDLCIPLKTVHVDLSQECQEDRSHIHASEKFLNKLKNIISGIDKTRTAFVALGSGTITDLLKHAVHLTKGNNCCLISIPSALTVTAYTSSFSVIDTEGAKRTRVSKPIDATFWIEPLLQAAPLSLSRAGYGDLLARFVAYGDWYLGHQLGISERYDETAYRLMDVFSELLKTSAEDFGRMELSSAAVENISAALAMAGIAMSVSGETTPLSGYEHAISHALDFLHLTSHQNLPLHGEQVALATLSSAASFDVLLEKETFNIRYFRYLTDLEAEKTIQKLLQTAPLFLHSTPPKNLDTVLSDVLSIFKNDYCVKNQKWNASEDSFLQFQNSWKDIQTHLRSLVTPAAEIQSLLEKAKLPIFPEGTSPPTTALEYRWALRFSPFVRTRFCLADFLFWIGDDPCFFASV